MMRTLSTLIVSCLLAACGEESVTMCQAICDREQSCDPDATCDPTCEVFEPRLLESVREQMTACVQTLACTATDDRCFEDAFESTPVRTIDQAFQEECLEEVTACELGDDICFVSPLFQVQHVNAAIACLGRPCDEIEACLGNTLVQ